MSLARTEHRFPMPKAARGVALVVAVGCLAAPSTAAAPLLSGQKAYAGSAPLPLGPADLRETRTTTTVEPGVTMTHIVRGAYDPSTRWVVELNIPSSTTSPDPDAPPRSVQDQGSADDLVRRLAAAGCDAQSQPVRQPAIADVPAGTIGYRVRATATFSTQAAATAYATRLKAAGFPARAWYAGWDGASMAKGQWSINVLTIDPRQFRGRLGATFGPDLVDRETTTALGAYAHAKAAVNGGFFVLDPKAGRRGTRPASASTAASSSPRPSRSATSGVVRPGCPWPSGAHRSGQKPSRGRRGSPGRDSWRDDPASAWAA